MYEQISLFDFPVSYTLFVFTPSTAGVRGLTKNIVDYNYKVLAKKLQLKHVLISFSEKKNSWL